MIFGWGGWVLKEQLRYHFGHTRVKGVDVANCGDLYGLISSNIVMVDMSRALTNRGENGCKGCAMQSGHHEHRLGRHFGLLYSRRVTWQENHGSPPYHPRWESGDVIYLTITTSSPLFCGGSSLSSSIFSPFLPSFFFLPH